MNSFSTFYARAASGHRSLTVEASALLFAAFLVVAVKVSAAQTSTTHRGWKAWLLAYGGLVLGVVLLQHVWVMHRAGLDGTPRLGAWALAVMAAAVLSAPAAARLAW